jgi:hypothetical protein
VGAPVNPEPVNAHDISERRLAGSSGAPIEVSRRRRELSRTKGQYTMGMHRSNKDSYGKFRIKQDRNSEGYQRQLKIED